MKDQPRFEAHQYFNTQEWTLKLVMPNPMLSKGAKKETADDVALILVLTHTTKDKQTADSFCDLLNKNWEIKPRKE